jgi:hypothetical protein
MTTRWMTLAPRDRLAAACEAALERLAAKARSVTEPQSIFAETGEALFWLFALGDDAQGNRLREGLIWARHQYAHGNLLTEAVEFTRGSMPPFPAGSTGPGTPPHHRWMSRPDIGRHQKSHGRPTAETDDYDKYVAGRPVIASLREELDRLL